MLKTQKRAKLKSMFSKPKPKTINMLSINKSRNSFIIRVYPGAIPNAVAIILNGFCKTYGLAPVKTSRNHFVISLEKAELEDVDMGLNIGSIPVSMPKFGYACTSIQQDTMPSIHLLKDYIRRHGCVIIE
jgi:hypothetical protein